MPNKTVVVPILNTEYKVVVCWGDEAYISKVLARYHHEGWTNDVVKDEMSTVRGKCFYGSRCYCVIALPKQPKTAEQIGTLAHEATHAVEYTFKYLNEESRDELYAHSVGAIVRETLKSIRSKQ